jgi:hypothetical protein
VLYIHPDPLHPSPVEDELRALIERARQGEAAAVPALRAALDEHPEIWGRYGDLAAHTQQAWVGLISGADLALSESLIRKTAALEATLAGTDPTPLERLLAARIAATWLQLHYCEASMAQSEVSLKHAEFSSKRQARAHRNYLMAIASLATIRRLLPVATSKKLPMRPGDRDPADIPVDVHPLGWVDSIPEPEDEGRLKDAARPSRIALFDRPEGGPNQDHERGLLGDRDRSTS